MAMRISTREKRLFVIAAAVAVLAGYGIVRYGKPVREARQAQQTKLEDLQTEIDGLILPALPQPSVETLVAELEEVRAENTEHEQHLAQQTQDFAMAQDNASLNRHRSMIARLADRSGLTIVGSRPMAEDASSRPALARELAEVTGSPRVLEQWTTRGQFRDLTAFLTTLETLDQHVSVVLMTVQVVDPADDAQTASPVLEAVLTLMM